MEWDILAKPLEIPCHQLCSKSINYGLGAYDPCCPPNALQGEPPT